MEELMLKLFDIEAVKFGNFTLKSGISSPVYFDLRVIISYPQIMKDVSELMWTLLQAENCMYQSVCGVPYTALPIATCISASHNVPMLIRRKEAKDYGTRKMIEGKYCQGDSCLIIEDVVTSGTSVLETVKTLHDVGLVVTDAIVLLDREQGGSVNLHQNGIKLHSVCGMERLLNILHGAGKLSEETISKVRRFIVENNTLTSAVQPKASLKATSASTPKSYSYKDRAGLAVHAFTRTLFTVMEDKKTNLCVSADCTTSQELLQLADAVGPHICILKTHIDILEDFTLDVIKKLRAIARTHNFLLFEDRKFADIGNTVKKQFSGGLYRISDWADLTNAHALPGPGIIQGLKEVVGTTDTASCSACLLIAEMSSKGNLATNEYTKSVVSMAKEHADFVVGFICQSRLSEDPSMVHMTPGVKLCDGGDGLGQQYNTLHHVIVDSGCDIIIVGRGITQASDPAQMARRYREAGFEAYQQCL